MRKSPFALPLEMQLPLETALHSPLGPQLPNWLSSRGSGYRVQVRDIAGYVKHVRMFPRGGPLELKFQCLATSWVFQTAGYSSLALQHSDTSGSLLPLSLTEGGTPIFLLGYVMFLCAVQPLLNDG